jgi:hypothetical protein
MKKLTDQRLHHRVLWHKTVQFILSKGYIHINVSPQHHRPVSVAICESRKHMQPII